MFLRIPNTITVKRRGPGLPYSAAFWQIVASDNTESVNHDGRIISPLSRLPESPALARLSRERRVQFAVPRIKLSTTASWIQGRSETRTIR